MRQTNSGLDHKSDKLTHDCVHGSVGLFNFIDDCQEDRVRIIPAWTGEIAATTCGLTSVQLSVIEPFTGKMVRQIF
jgi:hypothetical protein